MVVGCSTCGGFQFSFVILCVKPSLFGNDFSDWTSGNANVIGVTQSLTRKVIV